MNRTLLAGARRRAAFRRFDRLLAELTDQSHILWFIAQSHDPMTLFAEYQRMCRVVVAQPEDYPDNALLTWTGPAGNLIAWAEPIIPWIGFNSEALAALSSHPEDVCHFERAIREARAASIEARVWFLTKFDMLDRAAEFLPASALADIAVAEGGAR